MPSESAIPRFGSVRSKGEPKATLNVSPAMFCAPKSSTTVFTVVWFGSSKMTARMDPSMLLDSVSVTVRSMTPAGAAFTMGATMEVTSDQWLFDEIVLSTIVAHEIGVPASVMSPLGMA